MTNTNGDRDRQWTLEAARGDHAGEGALAYVRTIRAVRDHLDVELRQALDEGDAAHPDVRARWEGPDGEELGPPAVDADPGATAAFTKRTGLPPGPDELLAGLRNGAWLDAQDFPPLRYHVPGLLTEGSTLLVGPPKIGKSWFVLAVALAAAAGGRVLGIPVGARPVLYLALEDGDRRLQDRCRTLLAEAPIPAAFDYMTRVEPGCVVATIEAWLARHQSGEPLVILDTLGKVMPPALLGESSYQRDYRVGGVLKRLVDEIPGAALVTNHHDRKAGSEDFVDRVSGSNGLAGSADTIVVLARARHESVGLIEITGRDVSEGAYSVHFDGARGLWSLAGGSLDAAAQIAAQHRATDGLDERSRDIIGLAGERPAGVRAADVAAALGIDAHQARTYLARLADTDRLVRLGRGLYGPVASVASLRSDDPNATPQRKQHGYREDRRGDRTLEQARAEALAGDAQW